MKFCRCAVIVLFCCMVIASSCVAETSYCLGDFEDANCTGWMLSGDSNYLRDYSITTIKGGYKSSFALGLSMKTEAGWCGISAPKWKKLPVKGLHTISFDARGNAGCAEICIDINLSDGTRWWNIIALPRDGSWIHITAKPDNFFAVNGDNGSKMPDLDKLAALGFNLRQSTDRIKNTPATMDIDNVCLGGDAVAGFGESPRDNAVKAQSLSGVQIWLADTSTLPLFGQDKSAIERINNALVRAKARVRKVIPGKLDFMASKRDGVLVWEGPVCAPGDWNNIRKYLENGGALLWIGNGLPFSRVSGSDAEDSTAADVLAQGVFHSMSQLECESGFQLTSAGTKLWTGLQKDIKPSKCRFLTINDSIYLNTHWPWVEFIPLAMVNYTSGNWVAIDSPFTGSVASIFKHHSGQFAGARIFLASVSQRDSFLSADALTCVVKELSKPIKVDKKLAKLPSSIPPVTRKNFFTHPHWVIGGLDWGVPDWARENYTYGIKRLGMNVMNEGIPWRSEPDENGSVVDWEKMDKQVRDAKTGGWAVIFDGYCFGYERFKWAMDGGGKTTKAASIHNPIFAARFKQAMMDIAKRYKNDSTVVAIYATPDTVTLGFNDIDGTDTGREAWEKYIEARGLPKDLPTVPAKGSYDLSRARSAYIEFWADSTLSFMREIIRGIRSVTPDMPILLRGPFMDVALSFRLANEFKDIAPYCECQETSIDVESYFRGFGERYEVPIAGENGWPKARGSALEMAFATNLLGNYTGFLFSFTAIPYARPGLYQFEAFEKAMPLLKGAKYVEPKVGVIVPDSTIWASNPPNFFSAEGRASVEFFMERSGYPFYAISAQWPKLDGVSVLIDDGRNDVLRKESRRIICDWVRSGGTLIALPSFGQYDSTGESASLSSDFGFGFEPGVHQAGKGKVVVLKDIDQACSDDLIKAISNAGVTVPIRVSPYVNQAVFTKGGKTYLVLYNKSRKLVGAFFSEITLPDTEKGLSDVELTIDVPKAVKSVRDIRTGQNLKITRGKTTFVLPATQWRVLEFD